MGIIDNVVSGAQKIREVTQKLHDADLQNTIADLMSNVVDLKLELAELREENKQLRQQRDIRSKVVFRDNLYYATEPIEGYGEGPFCPVCLDSKGLLINIQTTLRDDGRVWRLSCGHCKYEYFPD